MKNVFGVVFIVCVTLLSGCLAVAQQDAAQSGNAPKQVNISAGVAVGMLLQKTNPVYPPIAMAARVSGTVVLQALISKTGTIENLRVISGPAMLQQASLDAVRTWRYRPYLLKGEPVEVQTTINVIFSLSGKPLSSAAAIPPSSLPPPSVSAVSGSSLTATMQFVEEKLGESSRVSYTVYTHDNTYGKDSIDRRGVETSNIAADPASCRVSYHQKVTADNKVAADADDRFRVRDVMDVSVMTGEQYLMKLHGDSAEAPREENRFDPPIFYLVVRGAKYDLAWFLFTDDDTANRVAKEMVHAVELCGGGNKDPF
jgi:TonB family protein